MIPVLQMLSSWLRFILRSPLAGAVVGRHPALEELSESRVLIVRNGDFDKWACFRCPGGCGEKIMLSLSGSRPRWSARLDWIDRPTLYPSVRQLNNCRCHFWVRKGRVEWCSDSGQSQQE